MSGLAAQMARGQSSTRRRKVHVLPPPVEVVLPAPLEIFRVAKVSPFRCKRKQL
jgi:hypothetical protein